MNKKMDSEQGIIDAVAREAALHSMRQLTEAYNPSVSEMEALLSRLESAEPSSMNVVSLYQAKLFIASARGYQGNISLITEMLQQHDPEVVSAGLAYTAAAMDFWKHLEIYSEFVTIARRELEEG